MQGTRSRVPHSKRQNVRHQKVTVQPLRSHPCVVNAPSPLVRALGLWREACGVVSMERPMTKIRILIVDNESNAHCGRAP